MWASSAVEMGRAYLRQMRKPAVAVTDLLTTWSARERFCIPLWHFGKAVDELRWWRRALEVCGGRLSWHVDSDGCFRAWRWLG
eukprot:3429401-Rhodomonas_salina.1